MIDLAAGVWKLTFSSAARKLEKMGLSSASGTTYPIALQNYKKIVLGRRQRMEQLWRKFGGKNLRWPASERLMNLLRLRYQQVPKEDAAAGPDRFMGAADCKEIEVHFAPNAAMKDGEIRPRGKSRIFKGKQWNTVLTVPFWDLPGRVASYWFIGRDGGTDDVAWKYYRPSCHSIEGGLAFHPSLLRRSDTVVAFQDVRRFLKLQIKHCRVKTGSLSLAAWNSQTRHAWQMLEGRDVVLWAERFDADLLRQAISCEGRIAVMGRDGMKRKQMLEFFQRHQPEDAVAYLIKQAKPWPVALARIMKGMKDHKVEELFLQLNLTQKELEHVISSSPSAVARRLKPLIKQSNLGSTIVIDNMTVEERSDGWWRLAQSGTTECISNGVLKINKVIRHPESKRTYYKGDIIYKGEKTPFCDSKAAVEKDTFGWMRDVLIDANRGVMTFVPSWSKRAVAIATHFHQPELLTGVERLGWDHDNSRFVLPKYSIKFGGKIAKHDAAIIDDHPAWDLPRPDPEVLGELSQLLDQDNRDNELFWRAMVCVLHNVIAPAVNKPTLGFAISGEAALSATKVAVSACSCLTRKLAPNNYHLLAELELEHRYPIALELDSANKLGHARQYAGLLTGDRNCLLRTNPYQALVLTLNGGWVSFIDDSEIRLDPVIGRLAKGLLPSFLHYLAKRQFEGLRDGDHLIDGISMRLTDWIGLAPLGMVGAGLGYKQMDQACGELLARLCIDGHVTVLPRNFHRDRKVFWRLDAERMFIPQDTIVNALEKLCAPSLNFLTFTGHLASSKCLVGEDTVNKRHGWIIEEAWWAMFMHTIRMTQGTVLRIHQGG